MKLKNIPIGWLANLLLLFISFGSIAQQTLSFKDHTLHFRQAKEYFDSKNYVAAREEFSAYLGSLEPLSNEQSGQKVLAEYYMTMCSLYMSQPEAEILAERFIANNPEHPQAVKLLRGIGTFFYDNGDYAKAIKYLSRSSETNLEAKFKLAISYFELKKYLEALPVFNEIKVEPEEEYALSASYYAGVINFGEKRYGEAAIDFAKAEASSKYRKEIPNWIGLCYFNQSKFSELLKYAEPIIAKKNTGYRLDELALLVADVQFQLNQFDKSIKSYEAFGKMTGSKFSPLSQYRYGFSLFKTKKYNEASVTLKDLVAKKDSLGQYAAFTTALAQLSAGNLVATLDAFQVARSLAFNPAIQEDAYFNYAKVLLDLGKGSETINEIQAFNAKFPKSKYAEEAIELVADAFINSDNLEVAVNYLKGISNRSPKLNLAYQTLSYNLGVRSYNDNQFEPAIKFFDEAILYAEKEDIKLKALLGKAESLSVQKKFDEAIQIYTPLMSSSNKSEEFVQKIRIGLAFAYFNTKEFSKANTLFKTYVDRLKLTPNAKNNPTILLRLADTYLVSRKYEDALNYYSQAADIAKTEKDYALFQKGMTLIYLNRGNEARAAMKQVRLGFPDSKFADEAFYQENLILFNAAKYAESILGFTEIISATKTSEFLAQAIFKRAQSYTNSDKYDLAILDYKRIVNEFTAEKIAKDALVGLQENLIKVGKPEEFGQVLEAYQSTNKSESENDAVDLKYGAARAIYEGKKFDIAITSLKDFISKYPTNENIVEANYLVADAADLINDTLTAIQYYQKVMDQNEHPQVNKVIVRAAELSLGQKKYSEAIHFYRMFKSKNAEADQQSMAINKIIAITYEAKNVDSIASLLTELEPLSIITKEEKAKLARSLADLYISDSTQIGSKRQWLAKVISLDKNEIGAEAQYELAILLSGEGKYKESNDMITTKFKNEFAEASDAVIGKSYILLAENFVYMKNLPQAKAILKSVIDNSSDTAVIELAKNKLKSLPIK
jgi:tetratricopeptide (TPR) repeat protein